MADGKGKWWEGLDPRLLYGIDLHEYKGLSDFKYNPEKGIFQNHLDYAHWYTTRWALRIEDVINKYDPDFFYTDGDSTGPFTGNMSGTGYKCDCTQRVIADFYNHTLATRGKVDTFAIIKFHPSTNGIVSTVESTYPKDIKRDQDWIGENPVGDWFYKPGIVYSSRALELYLLEEISRDGSYAVNIPISPEGAIDPGAVKMLHEMGAWMRINGQAVYGSRAWKKFGEGPVDKKGKLRTLPGGALDKEQAEFHFTTADFRFTLGKDGSLYAFVLERPKSGEILKITSLAEPEKPITDVSLLGSSKTVAFQSRLDGLYITTPQNLPDQQVLVFRIR